MKQKFKNSLPYIVTGGIAFLSFFFMMMGGYVIRFIDKDIETQIPSVWEVINFSRESGSWGISSFLFIALIVVMVLMLAVSVLMILKEFGVNKKDMSDFDYVKVNKVLAIVYTCVSFFAMLFLSFTYGYTEELYSNYLGETIVKSAIVGFGPVLLFLCGLGMLFYLYYDKLDALYNKLAPKKEPKAKKEKAVETATETAGETEPDAEKVEEVAEKETKTE